MGVELDKKEERIERNWIIPFKSRFMAYLLVRE